MRVLFLGAALALVASFSAGLAFYALVAAWERSRA